MRLAYIGILLVIAIAVSSCRDEDQTTSVPMAETAVSREQRAILTITPERPLARQTTTVSVALDAPTGGMPELEPIAGADVHLVAVNRDVSWYEHLHPRRDTSTWNAVITFPNAGEYVLHTIFRPKNAAQIVSKQVVTVGGASTALPRQRLAASPRAARSANNMIRLRTEPEPPAAGIWNSLIFTIEREGMPVTNLVPTGTLGHIVILREGGEDFVYAHSTDGEAMGGMRGRAHLPARPSGSEDHSRHVGDGGPEVTFHTRFPMIGKYRMWVEFRTATETIEADFLVDVEQPAQPEHRD